MKSFGTKLLIFLLVAFYSVTVQAKDWDPRLLQASDLAYQGKPSAAARVVEGYLQENPNDPNGYFVRGMIYDWERLLTPKSRRAMFKKTEAQYEKGNMIAFHLWDKDRKNIDKLIDLGNSYLLLGRVYSDLGSWLKAVLTAKKSVKHLEKAIELDPSRVEGLAALGVFHYVADNTPAGAAPFKALLGIKGSKTKGLMELKKATTTRHPYQNDAYAALYFIYLEYEKDYPKSLQYVKHLQQKFPKNPHWKLAEAEVVEQYDENQAISLYLALIDWCRSNNDICHPRFIFDGYFHSGRLSKKNNQVDKAEEYLSLAKQLDTKHRPKKSSQTFLWLGQIAQKKGNNPAAMDYFEQAQSVRGIPKSLKKEISQSIKELCEKEKIPDRC